MALYLNMRSHWTWCYLSGDLFDFRLQFLFSLIWWKLGKVVLFVVTTIKRWVCLKEMIKIIVLSLITTILFANSQTSSLLTFTLEIDIVVVVIRRSDDEWKEKIEKSFVSIRWRQVPRTTVAVYRIHSPKTSMFISPL